MKYKRNPNCVCSLCAKEIYRRPFQLKKGAVYCSADCFHKSSEKPEKCVMCTNMVLAKKNCKTCSKDCANKLRAESASKRRDTWKDKGIVVRNLKKKLLKLYGEKCQRCDYNKMEILEVHHIVERHLGGSNEISNLELLCPNCHAEEHYSRNNR